METASKIDPALNALTQKVIGAAIEVHRELGPGFLETVYEGALAVELGIWGIGYARQYAVSVTYKGHEVGQGYVDMLVENVLVVELKAVDGLLPVHTAQVISYLKALDLPLGLLINFRVPVLKQGIKRVVLM